MRTGWLVSLCTTILATVGVSAGNLASVPTGVLIGAAGLVLAMQIWQHHKTLRNADNAAVATKQAISTGTITQLVNDVRNDIYRLGLHLSEHTENTEHAPTPTVPPFVASPVPPTTMPAGTGY